MKGVWCSAAWLAVTVNSIERMTTGSYVNQSEFSDLVEISGEATGRATAGEGIVSGELVVPCHVPWRVRHLQARVS